FSAELAMGPLQTTALSGGVKKPIEINFTPYCSNGTIMLLPFTWRMVGCSCSQWNMIGTEGPYISASTNPTLAPERASATAKLDETVDFPTPPLPDAMAMMFFTFGSKGESSRLEVTLEDMVMSTFKSGLTS